MHKLRFAVFACRWYWKFAQQQLPGWAPILTANWVVFYFLAVTAVCLAIGIPVLVASINIKEYNVRYDNVPPFDGMDRAQHQATLQAQNGDGVQLTTQILIKKRMEPPVSLSSSTALQQKVNTLGHLTAVSILLCV